jgi:hypothetical protein
MRLSSKASGAFVAEGPCSVPSGNEKIKPTPVHPSIRAAGGVGLGVAALGLSLSRRVQPTRESLGPAFILAFVNCGPVRLATIKL